MTGLNLQQRKRPSRLIKVLAPRRGHSTSSPERKTRQSDQECLNKKTIWRDFSVNMLQDSKRSCFAWLLWAWYFYQDVNDSVRRQRILSCLRAHLGQRQRSSNVLWAFPKMKKQRTKIYTAISVANSAGSILHGNAPRRLRTPLRIYKNNRKNMLNRK